MELYNEPLHADTIPYIQPTELSDLDKFFKLQLEIERDERKYDNEEGEFVHPFLDGERGDDDSISSYENIRGGEDE